MKDNAPLYMPPKPCITITYLLFLLKCHHTPRILILTLPTPTSLHTFPLTIAFPPLPITVLHIFLVYAFPFPVWLAFTLHRSLTAPSTFLSLVCQTPVRPGKFIIEVFVFEGAITPFRNNRFGEKHNEFNIKIFHNKFPR